MARPLILIVEDDPIQLRLLGAMVDHWGYRSAAAAGCGEALAALAGKPVAILLDLQLPGTSGLDLARKLKSDAATAAIPLIAVTASALPGDEAAARAAGCDGYVEKPIDRLRLLAYLRRLAPVD